jgi:hypothetical protein
MKQFEVKWQFASGYETPRSSLVMAHDGRHAKELVRMLHTDQSHLRNEIEFLSVKEETPL